MDGFRTMRTQEIDVRMAPGRAVSDVMAPGRHTLLTSPLESRLTSGVSQVSDAQDTQDVKNNVC